MNALELIATRYDEIHNGMFNVLLEGLDSTQLRVRPAGMNSIAWLLWHVARTEDVGVNRFVAGNPQVLLQDGWNARLRITRMDMGAGMTSADVDEFDRLVDTSAVVEYWKSVAETTKRTLHQMDVAQLDAIVDPDRLRQILKEDDVLLPAAAWVAEGWSKNRTNGWMLLQTALLHPYGHLFDAKAVRGLILNRVD